jgi:hypothetical protein
VRLWRRKGLICGTDLGEKEQGLVGVKIQKHEATRWYFHYCIAKGYGVRKQALGIAWGLDVL